MSTTTVSASWENGSSKAGYLTPSAPTTGFDYFVKYYMPVVWDPPPEVITLPLNEIHLWRFRLDLPDETLAELWPYLNEDEQARAERFVLEKDRRRFTAGRGFLRKTLALYLGIEPEQVAFNYGNHGKPELANPLPGFPLQFNLSHSQNLALCGIALNRAVGVDLEFMRDNVDFRSLALRFFSRPESRALEASSDNMKIWTFFAYWTLKEAYLKGCGKGLALALDQFEINPAPQMGIWDYILRSGLPGAEKWFLRRVIPDEGFAGALAVEGSGWVVRFWEWPDKLPA